MQANKASIKAVLYNKIGYIALLFAIVLLFVYTKSTDFYVMFSNAQMLLKSTGVYSNITLVARHLFSYDMWSGLVFDC